MFSRKPVYVAKAVVLYGLPICILLSFLLVINVLFDDARPVVVTLQRNEPFSRIELVKRELLNNNNNINERYDDQDFISKTSEIAHKVFEIIPDIETTFENDSELYQVDYPTETTRSQPSNVKFVFVLHHYEQLGKTTENLLQLCALAKQMDRVVVEPFVRDSRMCGLPEGWYGEPRTKSRQFRPFSTYFDVDFTNNLLRTSGYATMANLETFKEGCSTWSEKTILVHFIYADTDAEESLKKWYDLSDEGYKKVINAIKPLGYCDCNFIDSGLNVSSRIGNLWIGRQICVDPEKVRSIDFFESRILQHKKCAIIVHWRGIGKHRTHFELNVTIKPWELVQSMKHSDFILREVNRFKEVTFLEGKPYIAIHVRSERQLQWYGVEKLKKCMKVMISLVEKMKNKLKISRVFLSTDLSAFGSDTLIPSQDSEVRRKLTEIQNLLASKLKPVFFTPRAKDLLLMDKGVVAIIEMNLLFSGHQLVTIGSGTFQQWIMDVFIREHSKEEEQDWSVTRVCNKEEKRSSRI